MCRQPLAASLILSGLCLSWVLCCGLFLHWATRLNDRGLITTRSLRFAILAIVASAFAAYTVALSYSPAPVAQASSEEDGGQ